MQRKTILQINNFNAMKRFFRFLMAAAVIFSAASCAKDVSVAPMGQEVEVAFVADLGGALGSRAIADGKTVDEVAWAVYEDGQTTPLENLQGTLVLEGKQATLNIRLATGKTYDIAFFAYKAVEAKEELNGTVDPVHYAVNWAEQSISMNLIDNNKPANDETRDCFWFVRHDLKIEGPVSETFTLTRPLAQLNLGVTSQDVADAKAAGFEVSDSQITVNTYTKFNMFDGSLSEAASIPVVFDRADSPVDAADILTVNDDPTQYKYLATTYLLVNEKVTSDVTVTLWDQAGVELNTLNYSYVPFQRNYRTNILGALLTNPAVFTIVVDERFNEPDNIVFHAFEYGGEVNLQGDMTVGHTLYVKKDAVLNLNGYTLRNHSGNKATDLIVVEEGATLTINGGGYLVAESGNDGYTVIAEGTVIINGGTFEAGVDANGEANALVYARGNGKVYVNGGVFNNAHNSAFVLNKKDADRATTVIEVRGGEFFKFNPENNLAEGPGTNFMAPGYHTVQNGDWYEVIHITYVSNADEFKAAAADDSVENIGVIADINLGSDITYIKHDVNLYMNGYSVKGGGGTTSKAYALGFLNCTANLYDVNMVGCGGIYSSNAKVIFHNGTLKTNYSSSGRHMFYGNNSEITILDGTFVTERTSSRYISVENNTVVKIEGGNFGGMKAKGDVPVYTSPNSQLIITGGTFKKGSYPFDPTPWVAAGYKAELANNAWTVVAE